MTTDLSQAMAPMVERNRERLAAHLFEPSDELRRLTNPTDEEIAEARAARERWESRTRSEKLRDWWRWRCDVGLMPERLRAASGLRRVVYWLER